LHSILILSALSSLPDPPIKSEGMLDRAIQRKNLDSPVDPPVKPEEENDNR